MTNCVRKRSFQFDVEALPLKASAPLEVIQAQAIEWNVEVDAYLSDAARVGLRYSALVYFDRSGVSQNGMTIATPPLAFIESRAGFKLMRSVSGRDHYVIASELNI